MKTYRYELCNEKMYNVYSWDSEKETKKILAIKNDEEDAIQLVENLNDFVEDESDEKGYGIFISPDVINYAEHIERLDVIDMFDSDLEASIQAENDGIKLIHDLPKGIDDYLEWYAFIDTKKNREIISDYLLKEYKYEWLV